MGGEFEGLGPGLKCLGPAAGPVQAAATGQALKLSQPVPSPTAQGQGPEPSNPPNPKSWKNQNNQKKQKNQRSGNY